MKSTNLMCDALVWSFDAITNDHWLNVIKALAPAATAIIAFVALKNWQRQDRAKRQAEFLDALLDATHNYIAEMPKPITLLEVGKIGMECNSPTWISGEEADNAIKGAIAYIEKNGEKEAKRLLEVLEAAQPSTVKLRSLAAKGQVFNFEGYAKCQVAVERLTWHFDRIEAFMVLIGNSTWNWENPEVTKQLQNVLAINPSEIRKSIREDNIEIIKFASAAYKRAFG